MRRDARLKVTGEAKFAGDIRLPGMLYAKIVRLPAHGAKRVRVVRDGDLTAVLHPYPDVAGQALAKIQAQHLAPKTGVNDQSIFDHLLGNAPAPRVIGQGGDLATGRKQAAKVIQETYLNSYVAHAPMETHTALAHFDQGRMTVWASTQSPFGVQGQVASAVGLPAEKVRVITPFVGGGLWGQVLLGPGR